MTVQNIICGNNIEELRKFSANTFDAVVTDPPYGIRFMSKKWDYDIPSFKFWKEVYRVLKPGGHMLVACGTKTQHRMVCNIEDAGFEVRDVVSWIYGSGFPKNLDISKQIDKLAGAERKVIGKGNCGNDKGGVYQLGTKKNFDITAPESTEAKIWSGWGTALKPAQEFFTLVRKPISEETIALNVLKWGTGAINIDDCRVGNDRIKTNAKNKGESFSSVGNSGGFNGCDESYHEGRFPTNLILDEEAGKLLDLQSGKSKSTNRPRNNNGENNKFFTGLGSSTSRGYNDEGGASRFFYCPKASGNERNKGLEGFIRKARPTMGDGIGNQPNEQVENNENFHPTVKPINLMRYLVRLITPANGVVLDPFNGSGSTGIACKLEGFNYFGIEIDPEYCKISESRIAAW